MVNSNGWLEANGSVTGAATLDLHTVTVPDNSTLFVRAVAVIHDLTNHVGGSIALNGSVTRGGGTTALDNTSATSNVVNAALAGVALALVVVGTTVVVRFTGVAGKTLKVVCRAEPKTWTP